MQTGPIPFPIEARRLTTMPNISTPVKATTTKFVQGAQSTPRLPLSAFDHLDTLDYLLKRSELRAQRNAELRAKKQQRGNRTGEVLHSQEVLEPQEVLHMRQCVEALRKIEDERHTERLRGHAHD